MVRSTTTQSNIFQLNLKLKIKNSFYNTTSISKKDSSFLCKIQRKHELFSETKGVHCRLNICDFHKSFFLKVQNVKF